MGQAPKYHESGGLVVLNPGDHICAIYSSDDELAEIVGEFLAEGIRKSERCWYLPASDDPRAVRAALRAHHVDTPRAEDRSALSILSSNAAYSVRGDFDPEETLVVFSNAIEQALADGFNGFRAAANMSWALDLADGPERLITYEALLRSLFSSARATGLCLYDRNRMPLAVIDGALSTHPVIRARDTYSRNAFYDVSVQSLRAADPTAVRSKLEQLNLPACHRGEPPSIESRDRRRNS
jgi:two-component system, chemotaxis family, sensor kinase Cph1